jgi:multiple sugar transport system permease protein
MTKRLIPNTIFHLFAIAFGLFMLYPIIWTFISSLKPESEIFKQATSLIPSSFQWHNYPDGWKGFGGTSFRTFFLNSFIISFLSMIGAMFTSSFVSFGFARLKFAFQKPLFACLMVTMMLPVQVTMIPQYILFHKLGWVNTFLPLIVPQFIGGNAFFIFLMMQFIRGIPKELDEAALIDGCSTYRTFWKIILPICKPALITVSIFSFIWTWDDFLGPLIYLNKPSTFTTSLGLRMFSDPSSVTNWGNLFAMSTLSLLPLFIMFFIFQRYIVDGIATQGLK